MTGKVNLLRNASDFSFETTLLNANQLWYLFRPKSYTDILASHDVEIGCSQSDATEPSQVKPPSLPTFIIVPREPDPTPDVTITVEVCGNFYDEYA